MISGSSSPARAPPVTISTNGSGWGRSARAAAAGEDSNTSQATVARAKASEARGTHREYAGLRTDARNAPPCPHDPPVSRHGRPRGAGAACARDRVRVLVPGRRCADPRTAGDADRTVGRVAARSRVPTFRPRHLADLAVVGTGSRLLPPAGDRVVCARRRLERRATRAATTSRTSCSPRWAPACCSACCWASGTAPGSRCSAGSSTRSTRR